MPSNLENKVAIVTGGTSGIGLATVEAFVAEGAQVVVGDIADEQGTALARRLGDAVRYVHADVTDDAQVEQLVATAATEFGKLDVFHNNAGAGGDPSPIVDIEPDSFDRTQALITRSVVFGHKHAARRFREQGTGGSIITTASAAALQGGWSTAGYTIGKHAVLGVVRQATAELAGDGIRSNAICPGIIMTPIMARTFDVPIEEADQFADFLAERTKEQQPIGRAGRTRDVANVAVFLASDLASFVTGSAIPVDGGATSVNLGGFTAAAAEAATDYLADRCS